MSIDVNDFLAKAQILDANRDKINRIKELEEALAKAKEELPDDLVKLFSSNGKPKKTKGEGGGRTRMKLDAIDEKFMSAFKGNKTLLKSEIVAASGLKDSQVTQALARHKDSVKRVPNDKDKALSKFNTAYQLKK